MAKDLTQKRLRGAVREEQKRRKKAQRDPRTITWRDLGGPDGGRRDDPDGGAGVREPRRPRPTMPAAALELDEPRPLYLDLTR